MGIAQSTLAKFELGKSDLSGRNIERLFAVLGSPFEEVAAELAASRDPDADLDAMEHAVLLAHARSMRAAIRAHRDATEHELCWHHPDMWALLPDTPKGGQVVPDWPQFMRGCIRYRASLDRQLAGAPRTNREYGE